MGVDVANLERQCPPEIFAPYLARLRDDPRLFSAEDVTRGESGHEKARQSKPDKAFCHYWNSLDDLNLGDHSLGLPQTLHQIDRHAEATLHFQRAGELASQNQAIVNSILYRNHLGLSSTLERHLSGGYRYQH